MTGNVSILNVGDGDTKLSFDKSNPAECLRAGRIVRDMLRRGYALLVEVQRADGTNLFQRAIDFDENTSEYIIADFDASYVVDQTPQKPQTPEYVAPPRYGTEPIGDEHEEASETPTASPAESAAEPEQTPPPPRGRGRPRARIAASGTRAVAVARSAGG